MSTPQAFVRSFHVVADDHGLRASLAMKIASWGGHAEIYEDMDELVSARPAQGAILIAAPRGEVSRLTEGLYREQVFLPVIVFAETPDPAQIVRAAHAGIADYLVAPFSDEELKASYDYSQRFMERNRGRLLRRQQAQSQVAELTERERQVLSFLLDGHSNKSIAKALELSPRTIEDYRLNALRKLGVTSTSAAIRIGIEAELATVSATRAGEPARA
jgi:two-component system response regulator FixJ